jgi:hypothetical protein
MRQERDAAAADVAAKQQAVKEKQETVAKLEQEIEHLGADQALADWIRQRQLSDDYTKHLGVVAKARDDFEQLTLYIQRGRSEAGLPSGEPGQPPDETEPPAGEAVQPNVRLPRIDRIVLYIDDLDRCPERVVEEVLQAVHLLLAFPLFVVVVGVDPRWLLHSLRRRSPAFQPLMSRGRRIPPEEQRHWLSTPLNYLEKIFQIPFTLRPLDPEGFGGLIDDLARPLRESPPPEQREAEDPDGGTRAPTIVVEPGPTPPTDVQPTPPDGREPVGAESDQAPSPSDASPNGAAVSAGSTGVVPGPALPPSAAAIDPNPTHLMIGEAEQAFMKALSPLISSPRAVKRFVNVYRLLKAMVEPEQPEAFEDEPGTGEYREILLLLAIQTGYPAEAAALFRSLQDVEADESWWRFLDGMAERQGGPGRPGADEAGRWDDLRASLHQLLPPTTVPEQQSCARFQEWAPIVARFSFHSGQALPTP